MLISPFPLLFPPLSSGGIDFTYTYGLKFCSWSALEQWIQLVEEEGEEGEEGNTYSAASSTSSVSMKSLIQASWPGMVSFLYQFPFPGEKDALSVSSLQTSMICRVLTSYCR